MESSGFPGISRSKRELAPAHYQLRIQSYSLLLQAGGKNYISCAFETGGHKWRLSLYPDGKTKSSHGSGYISLYLLIDETNAYPNGWEVHVNFKLFVFDQIRDKYLTIQDADGAVRRFNEMNKEWGFAQLVSLETFNDSSNGYLVDDSCTFGAEVCVLNQNHIWESLSMVKDPTNATFTWKLQNFSTLHKTYNESDVFTVEHNEWFLSTYPQRDRESEKDKWLSVVLHLYDCKHIPTGQGIYVQYKLRVLDMVNGRHKELSDGNCFCTPYDDWGFTEFITLKELNEASCGFIINDTLTIQVQILSMSRVKVFPEEEEEEEKCMHLGMQRMDLHAL